jgi:hypothetical protein
VKRRRALLLGSAAVLFVVGLVGVGHTRLGRPLLARVSGCPVAGREATPEQIEAQRLKTTLTLKGSTRAASRPANGFTLDRSTRGEVIAWGEEMHATCNEELSGAIVRCEHAANIDDALFRFDPKGILVGVDLMHAATDGNTAVREIDELASKLEKEAGAPTAMRGTHSGEWMSTPNRQIAEEFRFTDYAADLTATNFGERGVVIREQYRSIPN